MSGAIPQTGAGAVNGGGYTYPLSGSFYNVPKCAPQPTFGTHGEYVSGAAKAGIKGAALAAIAKGPTKFGPYPG